MLVLDKYYVLVTLKKVTSTKRSHKQKNFLRGVCSYKEEASESPSAAIR